MAENASFFEWGRFRVDDDVRAARVARLVEMWGRDTTASVQWVSPPRNNAASIGRHLPAGWAVFRQLVYFSVDGVTWGDLPLDPLELLPSFLVESEMGRETWEALWAFLQTAPLPPPGERLTVRWPIRILSERMAVMSARAPDWGPSLPHLTLYLRGRDNWQWQRVGLIASGGTNGAAASQTIRGVAALAELMEDGMRFEAAWRLVEWEQANGGRDWGRDMARRLAHGALGYTGGQASQEQS